MSKRFFDTGTWAKPWFRELTPADKVAWFYMLTNCDLVGVWDADTKLAEFCIGAPVDWEKLLVASNGNIDVLENGKWWFSDFCRYQYGVIKSESKSKVQEAIHSLLLRHGLWERYLDTLSAYSMRVEYPGTLQDKDKEKDKEKVKEKEEEKEYYADAVALTTTEYNKLVTRAGERVAKACIEKLSAWKLSKGATYKSDYHAILTWVLGAVTGQKGGAIPAPKAAPVSGPPCPECGKECVREFGYWTCGVHGRKEELG
jgi:hypothetical protein